MEGHGLLNFYRSGDTLKLLNKDGNFEKRAPWLGKWRAYEPTSRAIALPPELRINELGVKG